MSKLTHHLATLKPGHSALLVNLNTSSELHQRLMALGFRKGRQVTMLRRSWLSGPVHVRVGTTEVMLRLQDARKITISSPTTGALR